MSMTPDMIGMLIAMLTCAATIIGVLGTQQARFAKTVDARFDRVDGRIDRVDARIDRVEEHLGTVQSDIVEVKIAIARLEGPPRRLERL